MKKRLIILSIIIISVLAIYLYGPRTFLGLYQQYQLYKTGLTAEKVVLNGVRVAYFDNHTPQPAETIIMLHGMGAQKNGWLATAQAISDRDNASTNYRLILPDMFGHGESELDGKPEQFLPEKQAELIQQLTEELGIENYHVIGISLGGWVAGIFAHQNLDKVLSLGLVDNAGLIPPEDSEFSQQLGDAVGMDFEDIFSSSEPVTLKNKSWENPLMVYDVKSFDRLMNILLYKPPFVPYFVKRHLISFMGGEGKAQKEKMILGILNSKVRLEPLLPDFNVPVFVAWGRHDKVIDISTIDVMIPLLQQPSLHIYEESGHAPNYEQRKKFNRDYINFLNNLSLAP